MKLRSTLIMAVFFLAVTGVPHTSALITPHPSQLYEKGMNILNSYRGHPATITEAQAVFLDLVETYPESPFGYLGLSKTVRISAYVSGNHYNMDLIRDEALPLALKALELGPSIRDVHQNYAYFERIFEYYNEHKERARQSLVSFPENAETYYILANYMRDQNQYEKALEYYAVAIEMNPAEDLKLKLLKRVALLYLEKFDDPSKAVEYYQQALAIKENSPVVNEYIGIAYLKLKQYKLAIEKLSKSLGLMNSDMQKFHLMHAKGLLSEEEGRITDAIQYLEKASTFEDENSTVHYKLGNLYYQTEKYTDAFNHFKRVIDLSPYNPDAYYYAGRSAKFIGDNDNALNYFKKYLQFDTQSQQAEWIRTNVPELSQK